MRFSKAHTAVDKERVVGSARVFPYLLCCGAGKLVGFSGHMRDKGKGWIKASFKRDRARRSGGFIGISRREVAANVDGDRNIAMPKIIREACDVAKIIALDGVSHVAVRGQQG